jgi:hypothetical protein
MTETAAFLRFARDSRGYEYFSLVRPAGGRRGKDRSRVLYWFRTPPGVKVGRIPFDDEMRRAIEARNRDVRFDWPRLLATPIPPPTADVERWRERRRAERAARQTGRDADLDGGLPSESDVAEPEPGDRPPVAEAATTADAPPAILDAPPTTLDSRLDSRRTTVESRPASADHRRGRRRRRKRSESPFPKPEL